MRIIHLSDIHLKENDSHNIDIDSDKIIKALIEDLEKYNKDTKIDIVFITGDLIDKGGKSFNNIKDAFSKFEKIFIERISKAIDLQKSRFIFVPGNHDINRKLDTKKEELGIFAALDSIEAINKQIEDKNDIQGLKRIIPYKEFEKAYTEKYIKEYNEVEITNYQSTYIIEINGIKVGISCLNSAWRCYNSDEDAGRIVLGERQIDLSLQKLEKEECDIKIALIHHDTKNLRDFEVESTSTSIRNSYDFIFMGHVHKGSAWKTDANSSQFISVSPSQSGENRKNENYKYLDGYHVIDYDNSQASIRIEIRAYNELRKGFVENTLAEMPSGKTFYLNGKKKII